MFDLISQIFSFFDIPFALTEAVIANTGGFVDEDTWALRNEGTRYISSLIFSFPHWLGSETWTASLHMRTTLCLIVWRVALPDKDKEKVLCYFKMNIFFYTIYVNKEVVLINSIYKTPFYLVLVHKNKEYKTYYM